MASSSPSTRSSPERSRGAPAATRRPAPATPSRPRAARLPPLLALRAFDATVRSGSFTQAGELLHVTQGAISRQVKQLEDWLGKPLFVRHHQGLILTPAGSLLAQRLEGAFGAIEDAVQQIGQLGARQRIAVNVPETFASRWLAPRLRAFHGRHPDIDLSITTNAVPGAREAQAYDCLVMFRSEPWPHGACRLLRQEHYIAVASPELWQGPEPPGWGSATLLHILDGDARMPIWELWLASLGVRHVDPRPGIAFSTMDQAINAAVSGAGIAVVDAPMVERDLAEQRLRRVGSHELTGPWGYWFVEPGGDRGRDPAHSAVVALFQSWLLDAGRPAPHPPA